jgi:hypothetical protein
MKKERRERGRKWIRRAEREREEENGLGEQREREREMG